MKMMIKSILTLVLFVVIGSSNAGLFFDDFETDTSANYTYSDSYGSGGSFDIADGTLNVNGGVRIDGTFEDDIVFTVIQQPENKTIAQKQN